MATWHKLRAKTGFMDDTDHVNAQSSPDSSELYRAGAAGTRSVGNRPIGLLVLVTFVDDNDEILSPADGTTRGTFDMQLLRVLGLADEDGDSVDVICDSASLTSCDGYKVYMWDGMSGDKVWVRLTSITEPTTGTPTKLQVWVQEIERD